MRISCSPAAVLPVQFHAALPPGGHTTNRQSAARRHSSKLRYPPTWKLRCPLHRDGLLTECDRCTACGLGLIPTIWPAGLAQPTISTMNSLDGRIKANAAIVPAGASGAISAFASNTTDLVLEIRWGFQPASGQTLQFYSLKPCRVLDTRKTDGDLGGPYLQSGQERDFPVLESNCQIPNTAKAYSMNFTAVPYNGELMGYLTVWAQGSSKPMVSTLNNLTATIVANAAIVPAGTGGGIAVYPSGNTQLSPTSTATSLLPDKLDFHFIPRLRAG